MTARNDITGDAIASRGTTDNYRDNFDRIFGKKKSNSVSIRLVGIHVGRSQLSEDIGPVESRAEQYAKDELALEEMRTRMLP
jgi:hypothetical protein